MTLQSRISQELINIGVPAHLKGFSCLCKAVELVLTDEKYLHKISGCLYPDVAARFGVSVKAVERAMGTAIDKTEHKEMFRRANSGRVYTSRFVMTVAEIIKRDTVVAKQDPEELPIVKELRSELAKRPPVVHAHWVENSDRPDTFECSLCKRRFDMYYHESREFKFCPRCGAKMDEEV